MQPGSGGAKWEVITKLYKGKLNLNVKNLNFTKYKVDIFEI